MYAITVTLFLIPMVVLGIAWRGEFRSEYGPAHRDWRSYCLRLALFLATIATIAATGLALSKLCTLQFVGSYHLRAPTCGGWVFPLREITKWSVVATVGIGVFAKRKGRLFLIGIVLSLVLTLILWNVIAILYENHR
jgi:hypothetical protein